MAVLSFESITRSEYAEGPLKTTFFFVQFVPSFTLILMVILLRTLLAALEKNTAYPFSISEEVRLPWQTGSVNSEAWSNADHVNPPSSLVLYTLWFWLLPTRIFNISLPSDSSATVLSLGFNAGSTGTTPPSFQ